MSDIKDLKCACCKFHDSVDGCRAWSCENDFEINPLTEIKVINLENLQTIFNSLNENEYLIMYYLDNIQNPQYKIIKNDTDLEYNPREFGKLIKQ